MRYVCKDCGAVLSSDELVEHRSRLSDYQGGCYESGSYCPCGGDVGEGRECEVCGEVVLEDDIHDGVCLECLKARMTLENAITVGKDEKETVEINSFLSYFFTEKQIEDILLRKIKKMQADGVISKEALKERVEGYCCDDISWFASALNERGML